VEEKEGEQSSRPLPVQGNRATVLDDRQRAENAEFDGNRAVLALPGPHEQRTPVRPGLVAGTTLGP
jgi:hypothetical protein